MLARALSCADQKPTIIAPTLPAHKQLLYIGCYEVRKDKSGLSITELKAPELLSSNEIDSYLAGLECSVSDVSTIINPARLLIEATGANLQAPPQSFHKGDLPLFLGMEALYLKSPNAKTLAERGLTS